ncbi:hypothetical protein F4809DRAFT_631597 [Biscogniauxia mediterranea]|nr:hypothetical protein F4809DRAFT_631597 [Biscogniauxia mediterranea]
MPGIVEPEPTTATAPAAATAAIAAPPPAEPPIDDTPPRMYVVFSQHVELDIDFREKSVHGYSHILIAPTTDSDVSEVFIDARQCEIDVKKVTVSNCDVQASYSDPCDLAQTPAHYRWSAPQWALRKQRMKPLLHHRRKEVSALEHDLSCCTPLDGSLRVKLPSTDEVKRKNKDLPKPDQQDLLIQPDGKVGGYRISIPFRLKNVCDGLQFVGVDEADSRYPHVYTRHSVEPGTASAIFPCIDDPGSRNSWKISITCPRTLGDAFHQNKSTALANSNRKRKHGEEEPRRYDYGLTEEDKLLEMTVVCSGYLTGEVINKDDETKKTMTFEIDKNKAAKHIGFAVGPFEHVDLWSEFRSEEDDTRLGVSAAKVHGYCLPGRAEEVRNTCAALVTAVDHFVLHFGRYPFESYKVCFVDDMVEDTIPLCAFSLCSTRLLYPQDIIDTEVETTRVLVFSLASQWFGVNIIPNTKADIWLVVGIAWFMTDYFMKALCGNNEFRFRMKTMADRLVEVDMKRPSLQDLGEHLYLGDFEVEFMNLKAPLVLFILDRRLSKSSGSAGISRIISRMVSKANTSGQASDEILGSEAFRKACEKVGSTRLESFWNQWVVGSGCPRFDVKQRFNKKRLCVEMIIRQTQDIAASKPRPLDKDDFWRDVLEETHAVYAGELQHSFTGPMTIRIHEADGTPYEHIVEIRDDSSKSVRFEIPYNTKYKRLKRNRRQRERALANNNAKGNEENQKDLYYLGDVFQHPDEIEEWEFRDWDEETESKMDQESYEWIRMDADFEWICEMQTDLPPYMYASQLQQDRDVAAQQDSMLFLHRRFSQTGAHPLVSTILTRTLLDPRYFYGLRVMAANELPRHAVQDQVNWIGLKHLQKSFQHFFCYPGTYTPRPNNFADKRQYLIQSVIPEAVARVRGEDGKCPKEARRFILEQLQANNNADNVYSDQLYICRLIKALAICQVPDEKKVKQHMSMSLSFGDADEDEVMEEVGDTEPEEFRDMALEEIERYRRMDEYSPSYQNCFTVAALDALCRLMKAKVIPKDPLTFVQYLQDRTSDVVRIKACEALVDLDLLANPAFLRFFLSLLGTDSSPYVRDRLFKALCRGLASIAIGENAESGKQTPEKSAEDDLIVEQDSTALEAKQKAKARKEDLAAALAALKEETTDDEALQKAIWDTLNSPVLTVAERINILELCSLLVDEEQMLEVKFKYPTYWTVSRGERGHGRCLVTFKQHFRLQSRKKYATPLSSSPARPEPPKRTITLNVNKNGSFSSSKPVLPASSQPSPQTSTAPPKPTPSKPLPSKPVPPKSVSSKSIPSKPASSKPIPSKSPVTVSTAKPTSKPLSKPAPKPTVIPSKQVSAPPKPSVNISTSRAGTPVRAGTPARSATPVSVQEKAAKNGESHRDSIAVQAPVRPTIEPMHPEHKQLPPKVHGNGHLAPFKHPRPPKRASTESEGARPSKIVKLNTSKIVAALEQRLGPSKKLVTVKFNAWHKLKPRKRSPDSASIRATGKQHKGGKSSGGGNGSHARPGAANSPSASTGTLPRSSTPSFSSSSKKSTTPTPTTARHSQPQPPPSGGSSGGGGSNKPRKPLPDMRKPLPSAAPAGPPPSQPPPPPSSNNPTPAAPKAPTKLKIKLKPQS